MPSDALQTTLNNRSRRLAIGFDRRRLAAFGTLAGLASLWWLATHLGWVDTIFLPAPEQLLVAFKGLLHDGYLDATLWQHLSTSLGRVLIAVLAAVVTAVPLGIAMGLNPTLNAALDPLVEFYRPIPPLAYLPLMVIWFGIGELSKVLLIYLAIFAPIAIATATGVRTVDPAKVRAAQSLGATRAQLIRHVILPSALPDILTGMRIGLGVAWLVVVAAEMIALRSGLGYLIIDSRNAGNRYDLVIAGMIIIGVIGLMLDGAMRLLERMKSVRWRYVR
jgi:taurine transport system permease protein